MSSFIPKTTGTIKLDTQIKKSGESPSKTRPVLITLPSTLESICEEILSQHGNIKTLAGETKPQYILLSATGAPLDDGFIPYLNDGEKVILFEKRKDNSYRDRSSSHQDCSFGGYKKRSRSLSVNLQTVHKLFQNKFITEDEKDWVCKCLFNHLAPGGSTSSRSLSVSKLVFRILLDV